MTANTPQPDDVAFQDDASRIPVDGAELYVEQVGPPDAPIIYYLHGGPGYNSYSFRDLMEDDLQEYQLIYADQRGAGRSRAETLASSLDVSVLAEDVAAVAEALELPPLTLLAHGFGAQIALETALQSPELVKRLILVNPWVDMPLLARVMQRHAAFMSGNTDEALPAEDMLEGDPDPALVVEQAVMWVGGKELLDTLQLPKPSSRLRLEHSDSEALVTMEALGQFYIADDDDSLVDIPLWSLSKQDALTSVRVPVVVLLSQDDKTAYPEQAEVILKAMGEALVSVLEGGHYPWLDDPETFSTLLTEIMQADIPTD
ncbi:MAG: alpha/beta hydrolase [Deinococcota bacterium]